MMEKVNDHFQSVRLSEVIEINPKLPVEITNPKTLVSFLPMKLVEAESNVIHLSETKEYEAVKKGFTSMADHDVIFAKITPCMENGKIAIVHSLKNGIAFGSTEFHVLRCTQRISNKYLFYYLIQKRFRREAEFNMNGAVGQRRVPKKFLEDAIIPLPEIKYQSIIVAKIEELFSELDKGIENLRITQQQLKIYRQAVLKWAFEGKFTSEFRHKNNVKDSVKNLLKAIRSEKETISREHFTKLKTIISLTDEVKRELPTLPSGWEWVKNEELLLEIKDGTHDSPSYTDVGIRFITQKNIREKGLDIKDVQFISEEDHNKFYKRSNAEKGDILISMIGHNRGMIAFVNTTEVFSIKNVGLFKFIERLNNPKFCYYYYKSSLGLNRVLQKSKGGAQPFIGLTELRNWPMIVCSLEEQKIIVEEIESRLSIAEKLEEIIMSSLQQAEALRQSILKQAFEGKLVNEETTIRKEIRKIKTPTLQDVN